ncbi:hypothetical protein IKF74_01020 [Candidatus Saccharibacteria bacterium]|nr:hypothetical protein [Candidatus Saccharibacteria bacterium]
MSKKLIAGAGVVASLAVALAPLATFAEVADTNVRQHTDTLNLTIPEICTLGTVTAGAAIDMTDETTHNPTGTTYTGSWTNGSASQTTHVGRTDTLAADVYNGQAYANLGATVFTIRCNDNGGYTLSANAVKGTAATATAGNLTHSSGNYTIPTGTGISNDQPVDLTADGSSYWNFRFAVSNEYNATSNEKGQEIASGYNAAIAVPASSTTIVTGHGGGNTNTGETVTVTYGAGIDVFQEAGVYDGSVLYTLAQL